MTAMAAMLRATRNTATRVAAVAAAATTRMLTSLTVFPLATASYTTSVLTAGDTAAALASTSYGRSNSGACHFIKLK
jgi:hypothetical protein